MRQILNKLTVLSLAVLFIAGCKPSDDDPVPVPSGSMMIHFENKVGDEDMVLNNQWYKNQNGDSFTVSLFKYYISNIQLNGESGALYTEKESYHLIDQSSESSRMFTMSEIPAGKYTSITFMIGVDSLRNVSGAQTGALDVANGMFWSWSTGYIMAKFEGKSPKSTQADNKLMFHIGGFEGENNVIKKVTLNFPQPIEINSNTAHMHFHADLMKWFHPNHVDFSVMSAIHMSGSMAKKIADNYASMISVAAE